MSLPADEKEVIIIRVHFPKNYTYDTYITDTKTVITCISNANMIA